MDCARDHDVVSVTARAGLHKAISQFVYQYRRHLQTHADLDSTQEPPANYVDDLKMGFLLRSSAVSGWPGLEVTCYDGDRNAMQTLRMDHLGGDLLFCLVAGQIKHVVIREPAEGLRFGLDDEHTVMMRCWNTGTRGSPIEDVEGREQKLEVNLQRAGAKNGVLDIAALAEALSKNLASPSLEGPTDSAFGSAAFALQMTRSPEKQQIDVGSQLIDVAIQDNPHHE